jgi:hypothetical protein
VSHAPICNRVRRSRSATGRFTVEINGVPLLNRDGKLVTSDHMPHVMLRICEMCHRVLNTRFKEPAKVHVQAALDCRYGSPSST